MWMTWPPAILIRYEGLMCAHGSMHGSMLPAAVHAPPPHACSALQCVARREWDGRRSRLVSSFFCYRVG